MTRLLPCVLLLGVLVGPALAAECPGDCDGDGTVSVAELVVQVQIALGQRPVDDCRAADLNGDGVVGIDELVFAVASAVRGCAPTPTITAAPTASFTAQPTTAVPSPTASETVEPTASDTPLASTATPTQSASPTDTSLPTSTASATVTAGTPSETPTSVASPTSTATASRTQSSAPTATATDTRSATRTASFTATATPSFTPTSTPTSTRTSTATVTPTATLTPTRTATPAPGVRRFSLNPKSSGISTFSAPNMQEDDTTGFEGYLDLALGAPDGSGVRPINIVGASPFLSLPLGGPDNTFFCLQPVIPVDRAGVVDCDGGSDLGVKTTQDHVLDTANCAAAGGVLEQATDPHPGVCNGPLALLQPSGIGDSDPGAVLIAPSAQLNTLGFLANVSVEPGPCATHATSQPQVFGFASGLYRVEILHADAEPATTLLHDETGQNFDCANWAQENGPGRLVLSIGVIHGGARPAGNGTEVIDLVTVFTFDD